jgi:hypothetical protein
LGDTLSALEFYYGDAEYPPFGYNLLEEYGPPDRVTWGHNAANRTMIWAKDGLMVNIERVMGGDVDGDLGTGPFFLFPPMDAEELDESWIMQSIPAAPTEDELAKMPREWQVEDPWGYNDK